ncbi:hypothetical protein NEOLI_005234 [Neolecta irregularis DAH-3]|uniref:Uncharacterized protein n=1 Tax=Neolecta irregularis (strain DAH-3) TaxID=1198029 RepID=A0A1U7LN20_NEOID|nr:hypothetical protein NEOLI_005234 [Neolecta irregularis DAH-3]|eukprot:OLL23942.1 hypothetical protein NEOLI_005234 [Neolecta irregularis DAH-3]
MAPVPIEDLYEISDIVLLAVDAIVGEPGVLPQIAAQDGGKGVCFCLGGFDGAAGVEEGGGGLCVWVYGLGPAEQQGRAGVVGGDDPEGAGVVLDEPEEA